MCAYDDEAADKASTISLKSFVDANWHFLGYAKQGEKRRKQQRLSVVKRLSSLINL